MKTSTFTFFRFSNHYLHNDISNEKTFFTSFIINNNISVNSCTTQVRDGDSASSTLLGRFCGGSYSNYSSGNSASSFPGPITSYGGALRLEFHSDYTMRGNGFLAYFSAFDTYGKFSELRIGVNC